MKLLSDIDTSLKNNHDYSFMHVCALIYLPDKFTLLDLLKYGS